jgi:hypothetical protein
LTRSPLTIEVVIQRGRRFAAEEGPEPQARDLELLRALHRYRYLSTSLIARTWWRDCHPTRAQVRLRRMFDAGWVDRMRPRLARGSHEWIYRLAKPGFLLGQTYRRGNDTYIPRDAKWRADEVADLDYVWHDLDVNEWMLSYADLLRDRLEDWLGPSEARLEIATTFCPRARRHVPLTADQVLPRGVYARDLQLGRELRPLLTPRRS